MLVKLAGFLVVLSLAAAAASPSNQHGTRVVAVQTAYLVEPVEIPAPDGITLTGTGDQAMILQRVNELTRAGQVSAQAPVAVVLNGRTLQLVPPRVPTPSAVFETWVEQLPSDYQESITAGFSRIDREANQITAHRFVRDNFRHAYASYAVTVEMLPESGKYRVAFGASPIPSDVRFSPSEEWKVATPSHYPVPQILEEGETMRLELYTDPRTGQTLVEYLHVGKPAAITLRKEAAHDSYADDAQFVLTRPRLKANGMGREPAVLPDSLSGPILWVYVPGYGRYVLSFLPHQELGFERAGEVSGSSLIFSAAGNLFRIESADRIAGGGSGAYNVYALPDPSWQPSDPEDRARFVIGAAPGVE